MKLVHAITGAEVKVGQRVHMRDGEVVKITGIEKPRSPASTGRVYVENLVGGQSRSYFPSVVCAKWIEREDQ